VPGDASPPPDPAGWDDLTTRLRALRARAGSPSYAELVRRVDGLRAARGVPEHERRPGRVTVYDAFRDGRVRLDVELLADLVRALGGTPQDATAWRDAHAAVAGRGADGTHPGGGAPLLRGPDPVDGLPRVRGRDAELDDVLAWAAGTGPRAQVAVLTGVPGAGLSTVVRTVAARHRAATGGTVQVTEGGADVDAVVAALARPTGPAGSAVPLLVVDDARGPDQVQRLADGLPGWSLLVTSRRSLAVAGSRAVTLGPLHPAAAVAVLGDLVGADRVAAEPEAAAALAAACGYLPVALAVAAGRVDEQPGWSLADHEHRVAGSAHALPALDAAYRALDPEQALVLRRLALHPAPLPTVWLAVLAGLDVPSVRRALAVLEDAQLVRADAGGRSTVHALVRRYAVDAGHQEEPVSARRTAVARLAERLLDEARPLVAVVAPHHDLPAAPADAPTPAEARSRLDDLRGVAVGAAGLCAALGLADLLGALSGTLAPYLDTAGRWSDAVELHTHAVDAADPAGRSRAGRDVGRALEQLGRYDEALAHLVRAHESGHDPRPGQTLNRIGNVYKRLGRTDEALRSYAEAAAAARVAGDAVSEGRAVGNHADVLRVLGRHAEAFAGYDTALALAASVGDTVNTAVVTLNSVLALEQAGRIDDARARVLRARAAAGRVGDAGMLLRADLYDARMRATTGRPHDAVPAVRAVVERAVELGDVTVEAEAGTVLGHALLAAGEPAAARAALTRARALGQRLRARLLEAEALNGLGAVALADGDTAAARDACTAALAVADAAADTGERVRALTGLGDCAAADGATAQARARWTDALTEAQAAGLPAAAGLRARLDTLPGSPAPAPG
jgi:tetratricopeptide (TPR) repeat protein